MLLVGDLEVGFNFRCCHVTSRLQRVAWAPPALLAACKTLALQLWVELMQRLSACSTRDGAASFELLTEP